MKNTLTLQVLVVAIGLSVISCNNSESNKTENGTDTTTTVKEEAKSLVAEVKDAVNGNQDSNFVVKAARTNMAELKVLQAGMDNGSNKELKMHAKMMITDHKKMGGKVSAYATKKGYTLPATDDGKGDEAVTGLNKNTKGNDWDKAWVNHMVDAHKDVISMFESAQKDVKDEELRSMITESLPTLHSHLDMMNNMHEKMSK